jgi:hypothetical protein
MATKNRSDLKSYFVKNAIPTEGNFADLIDSQLNQTQDGVFKPDGDALSVVAASGEQKRVLRLFASYPGANPDWMISLNPAQDPADTTTVKLGFGITDGTGKTRLFIDAATGQIGVGTNTPQVALDVTGTVQATGFRANGSLMIRRDVSSQLGPTLTLQNNSSGSGAGGAIDFNGYDPGTNDPTLRIQSKNDGSSSSHLTFLTKKPGANTNTLVERMWLTSDGLLQFSNDSPKDKIVIYESGASARFGMGLNSANISLFYPTNSTFSLRQNGCSGTEVFSVDASGNTSMSGFVTTKNIKLNSTMGTGGGGFAWMRYDGDTGTLRFYQGTSGSNGYLLFGTGWGYSSDVALKTDIVVHEPVLGRVMKLRPVRFRWKADGSDGSGFIAQEVEGLFPDLVHEGLVDEATGRRIKGLTYERFGMLAVAAIKELKMDHDARLDALERILAAREGKS